MIYVLIIGQGLTQCNPKWTVCKVSQQYPATSIPGSSQKQENDKGEIVWETYNFPDGKNDDRWYHWCIENWGTKWDVSELDIEYDDEVLELTFSTAWSPPEGVMQVLKDKYPDLGFTCFYDEPGMEVAGYYQDSLQSVHLGLHCVTPML